MSANFMVIQRHVNCKVVFSPTVISHYGKKHNTVVNKHQTSVTGSVFQFRIRFMTVTQVLLFK